VVVQGILRDVTARHELERMKDEFIAVVSHELRTPLTAIRGALGLLETGVVGEVSEAGRTLARIGRSNSDRLIRLVNDILDLESVVAGGVALNIEPLTANGLVEPALRALASIADEANVALQRDVGVGDDLEFQGDRDRLAQVLTNLLDNAIKFSPPGTSVTVRTQAEGEEHVRICVQDRGPGISKADQQRLFQRFGMLDSSNARKASGTGLGLAISKAIVDLHGGSVGVESAPGKGATFYFSLPRRPLLPELKAADADEPAAAVG
jgi:signal transduction histidine kinase